MSLDRERFSNWRAPALLRQAAVYGVSQLGAKAIPFLLLPVMTRFLSPSDYGIVTMFLFVALILEPVVGLGLNGAVTVKFYDRDADLGRYISTGLSIVGALAVVAFLLVILSLAPLSQLTQVPVPWLLLAVPLVVARVIAALLLALLRVREQPTRFGAYVNLQTLVVIGASLVLVIGFGLTWRGRIAGEVAASWLFAAVAIVWIWRMRLVRRTFDRRDAAAFAVFGIPLIPHLLGGVLMVQTDRVLLTNLVGIDRTGLYAVGYQVGSVVDLAAIAFNNAYAPWLFRSLGGATDEARRRLVRLTYLQFAVMGALALFVAIVFPWLATQFLGDKFAQSADLVPWFAIAFLFSGMYYMVANYIFYAQRTRALALVTLIVAMINIPLTFALITINGTVGAAQALAITYGLSFVMTWIVSNRSYPMPWLSTTLARWRRPA